MNLTTMLAVALLLRGFPMPDKQKRRGKGPRETPTPINYNGESTKYFQTLVVIIGSSGHPWSNRWGPQHAGEHEVRYHNERGTSERNFLESILT